MRETASLLSLILILSGCASFGVFNSQGGKDLTCTISDGVLTELQALASAYGVDLSLLVKEWSVACANAAVKHANYSEKALEDIALKAARSKALLESKGNEKSSCQSDAHCM